MSKLRGFTILESLIALIVIIGCVLPFVFWGNNARQLLKQQQQSLADFYDAKDAVLLKKDCGKGKIITNSQDQVIGVSIKNYEIKLLE